MVYFLLIMCLISPVFCVILCLKVLVALSNIKNFIGHYTNYVNSKNDFEDKLRKDTVLEDM